MGQTHESAPSASHTLCACANYWIGPDAPHSVHDAPAVICHQVEGAPQYGREAHTVRECYAETTVNGWKQAFAAWKASGFQAPAPMPVGHLMFAPLAGSSALSRRDNAERAS